MAIVAGMLLAFGSVGCVSTAARDADAELAVRKATSHLNLGADHLEHGRAALALRDFLAAEKFDPLSPRVQYALGEGYLARQRAEQAETHYRRALELNPGFHEARLSLSALLIVRERYEEARAECQVLVDDATFPATWRALANRGWSEYKLGRVGEARKSLQQAIDYAQDYWPAVLSLAVIESEEGRRREAIGLLEELIQIGPPERVQAEANYRLAENYIALGRRDRAVGHLSTAAARAPDGEWARRSKEYLRLLQ
jgi:Tfp pilus assembly protein PilF